MVRCVAAVENQLQRENLFECLTILGAKPRRCGDSVSVLVNEKDAQAEKIINLFKHYLHHEIRQL